MKPPLLVSSHEPPFSQGKLEQAESTHHHVGGPVLKSTLRGNVSLYIGIHHKLQYVVLPANDVIDVSSLVL